MPSDRKQQNTLLGAMMPTNKHLRTMIDKIHAFEKHL